MPLSANLAALDQVFAPMNDSDLHFFGFASFLVLNLDRLCLFYER